jgi:Lrp/AsnC family transcriptional regulator for asnA, asnC and gidA
VDDQEFDTESSLDAASAQNQGLEHVDAVDRVLITHLQKDGRMPYSDLAAAAGLSAGGARLRVKRLKERGILDVVGVTDPLKLGYRSMAMLGIRVQGDVEEVANALGRMEEVIYVVLAAGSIDILAEVIAPDNEGLFDVINRRIRFVSGIASVETYTYYRTHTHRFTWGVH